MSPTIKAIPVALKYQTDKVEPGLGVIILS